MMADGANPAPRVSVLMPARNAAAFIAEAVGSVLHQRMRDLELIVVDDGSTDETAAIVADQAASDSRIRLLRQPPKGIAAALNHGLAECRARLIARLDADDTALPDRLARQAAFLDHHPKIAVLGGAKVLVGPDGRETAVVAQPTRPDDVRRCLMTGNAVFHPTVMMRREVVLAAGGYRPAFDTAEDYDLWLRVSEHAAIANLNDVLIVYRQHPGQVSVRNRKRQQAIAELARFSARLRRQGLPDPFDAIDRINADILPGLGLGEALIAVLRPLLADEP